MPVYGRQSSSGVFVISEGQFYTKPSVKLEKLEKEQIALKARGNQDQVELRRLRSENSLLQQRIENLEKESAGLANKLVQDQVSRAQAEDHLQTLQAQLCTLQNSSQDSQTKLSQAQNVIAELRKRNHICADRVHHVEEESDELRLRLRRCKERELVLQQEVSSLSQELVTMKAKSHEEAVFARIKEAENIQELGHLRSQIARMDIQAAEVAAKSQLSDGDPVQDSFLPLQEHEILKQIDLSKSIDAHKSADTFDGKKHVYLSDSEPDEVIECKGLLKELFHIDEDKALQEPESTKISTETKRKVKEESLQAVQKAGTGDNLMLVEFKGKNDMEINNANFCQTDSNYFDQRTITSGVLVITTHDALDQKSLTSNVPTLGDGDQRTLANIKSMPVAELANEHSLTTGTKTDNVIHATTLRKENPARQCLDQNAAHCVQDPEGECSKDPREIHQVLLGKRPSIIAAGAVAFQCGGDCLLRQTCV